MSFRFAIQILLCSITLLASACTETVIREVPADASENGLFADANADQPDATDGLLTPAIAPTTVPPEQTTPAVEPVTTSPATGPANQDPQAPTVPIESVNSGADTPTGSFCRSGSTGSCRRTRNNG